MAKKIATKVNYQVTELVSNLNEAATTLSEQKRDFYTTKALYNAKRLSAILGKAKVGALSLMLVIGMSACGTSATPTTNDSTAVAADTSVAVVDTTATQVVDTASVVK